jgi:hypothetical protein
MPELLRNFTISHYSTGQQPISATNYWDVAALAHIHKP